MGFLFTRRENSVARISFVVYPQPNRKTTLDDFRPDNPERGGVALVQVCLKCFLGFFPTLLLHITMNRCEVIVPPFPRLLSERVILLVAKLFPN